MKVCFISFEYPPSIIGGLGIYAGQFSKGLIGKGIEVLTITRGNRDSYSDGVFRVRTPNILYWQRLFFISQAVSLFHRLNKRGKFDLVHLNGAYPIARGLKLPTVITFHSCNFVQIRTTLHTLGSIKNKEISSLLLRNPVGSIFDILSAHLSDEIICPSPSIAEEIRAYCGVNEKKIHVIPNGFDLESFDNIKAADISLLKRYDIEKNGFVLYVGRLTYIKGLEFLIKAFKTHSRDLKNLKLVIMGKGPQEQYLRDLASDLQDVLFIGHIENPEVKKLIYESSLAVVVPSIHETLPMVILEAMAHSKPVIATSVGGNTFLIRNGKNGCLVEPRDPEGIARSIAALLDRSDLGKEMGEYGRRLVEMEFSLDKMVNEALKIYDIALQKKR